MTAVKVTLRNAPIKTFPMELNFPDCYVVASRAGSAFQKVKAEKNEVTVIVDDPKNGTLVMYTFNKDTQFQIIPPSCVFRNSDGDIKYVVLNDDVPRVHCDGQRMDFERDEDD